MSQAAFLINLQSILNVGHLLKKETFVLLSRK